MLFLLILFLHLLLVTILMCNEWNIQLIHNHNYDNYYNLTNITLHKIKTRNQNYVGYDCTHSQEGRNLNLNYYTQVYLMHISVNQKFCNYDKNSQKHIIYYKQKFHYFQLL
eukprot:191358_1